jgi:hypothetical protein
VPSRIVSAAWSTDGTMLALGMISGLISIRNQQAIEIHKFEKKAPVWCLTFIPDFYPAKLNNIAGSGQGSNSNLNANPTGSPQQPEASNDLLAVGCWDKSYSLYRVGANLHKLQTEKVLKYYPCSMSYSTNQATKSTYLVNYFYFHLYFDFNSLFDFL